MDIDAIISKSPDSILKKIAERVKEKRLERNLTQKAFAKRAGVGYDAYRTFENTGEITVRNLVLCAIVLDEADDFAELFTKRTYQSIDELLKMQKEKKSKGINPDKLTVLQRLSLVGSTGRGALEYQPDYSESTANEIIDFDHWAAETQKILTTNYTGGSLDTLYKNGGSQGGARPSINEQIK